MTHGCSCIYYIQLAGFRGRLALTPFSVLQLDELLRHYCGQHDTTDPGTIGVTVRCCFTSFVLGIASYSCCCDLLVEIVCVRLVFLILRELSYYRGRAIVSRLGCGPCAPRPEYSEPSTLSVLWPEC